MFFCVFGKFRYQKIIYEAEKIIPIQVYYEFPLSLILLFQSIIMVCKSSLIMMASQSRNISGLMILLTFVSSCYTFSNDPNEKDEGPNLLAKEIGQFIKTEHAVSGNVFIQDNATLFIQEFNYDGTVRQKFIVPKKLVSVSCS